MPVPEPGLLVSKTRPALLTPLSAIESFQSVPKQHTNVICPSFVFSLNACLERIYYNSVAIQSEALG